MFDELNLPDELRACEARLAAKALPATSIDRDQLMYRAGWAAGAETARLACGDPPPSKVGPNRARSTQVDRAQGGSSCEAIRGGIPSRRATAALCFTSAALAASLAIAITLQLRPQASRETVAAASRSDQTPSTTISQTDVNAGPTLHTQVPSSPSEVDLFLTKLVAGSRQPSSPLFAQLVHQRTLADVTPTFAADANSAPTAQAKSARELLDEILPHGRPDIEQRPLFRAWPWSGTNAGETI